MLTLATNGQDDGITIVTSDGPIHIQIARERGKRLVLGIEAPKTVGIFRDRVLLDKANKLEDGAVKLWNWARQFNPLYKD